MSYYEEKLKEFQDVVFNNYLENKKEMPDSLKELLLFEIEQSVDNLDKEYFMKNFHENHKKTIPLIMN